MTQCDTIIEEVWIVICTSNLALKTGLNGFDVQRYNKAQRTNVFSPRGKLNNQNHSNLNREFLSTYEKGISAERTVITKLQSIGYKILGHRIRTGYGEIDILASQGTNVVAFEVKQRTTIDEAKACLSEMQQKRIAKALLYIASERNKPFETYRIDVVCLDTVGRFEHIKNAFSVDELVAC